MGDLSRFNALSIHGHEVSLSAFEGDVCLIVNVASRCGYTRQYKGLQALHEAYAEKGLRILAFPCNQFGGQEPGTSAEIAGFCESNYAVGFPVFAKIAVNGATRTLCSNGSRYRPPGCSAPRGLSGTSPNFSCSATARPSLASERRLSRISSVETSSVRSLKPRERAVQILQVPISGIYP